MPTPKEYEDWRKRVERAESRIRYFDMLLFPLNELASRCSYTKDPADLGLLRKDFKAVRRLARIVTALVNQETEARDNYKDMLGGM